MKRKSEQNSRLQFDLEGLEKAAEEVCQDFKIFCDYLLENKVKLAKKTGHIGKKDCFALNALLQVRENYEKPNYFQNQYPVINFFYYIAIKYKILKVSSSGTALQCGKNNQFFQEASTWEQYILLLVVFMFDGIFAERGTVGCRHSDGHVGDICGLLYGMGG